MKPEEAVKWAAGELGKVYTGQLSSAERSTVVSAEARARSSA